MDSPAAVEKTISGHVYQLRKMPAFKQFHVARRIAPALAALFAAGSAPPGDRVWRTVETVAAAIGQMSDADSEYVLTACLGAALRRVDSGANGTPAGWQMVIAGGGMPMFSDIDLGVMMEITWMVLEHNLAGFISALPQISPGAVPTPA